CWKLEISKAVRFARVFRHPDKAFRFILSVSESREPEDARHIRCRDVGSELVGHPPLKVLRILRRGIFDFPNNLVFARRSVEHEIRFWNFVRIVNGFKCFWTSVIQVQIDMPDFEDVAFGTRTRTLFEGVHADVDVESRPIPLCEPLLKIACRNVPCRCDTLDDFLGGTVPKQDSNPVGWLEVVEDVVGWRNGVGHRMS